MITKDKFLKLVEENEMLHAELTTVRSKLDTISARYDSSIQVLLDSYTKLWQVVHRDVDELLKEIKYLHSIVTLLNPDKVQKRQQYRPTPTKELALQGPPLALKKFVEELTPEQFELLSQKLQPTKEAGQHEDEDR